VHTHALPHTCLAIEEEETRIPYEEEDACAHTHALPHTCLAVEDEAFTRGNRFS
jgi:hypothetical protein